MQRVILITNIRRDSILCQNFKIKFSNIIYDIIYEKNTELLLLNFMKHILHWSTSIYLISNRFTFCDLTLG